MSDRDALWSFIVTLYGEKAVMAACLALQDEHGLDVDLLLYACWAAGRGYSLDDADLDRLSAAAKAWQDGLIKPVRALRRRLRRDRLGAGADRAESFRRRLEAIEIEAERVALDLMASALPIPAGDPAGAEAARLAEAALGRIVKRAGAERDPATRARTEILISALGKARGMASD